MPSFAETGQLITVGAIQAGLGLAVGGHTWVESEGLGCGSTFCFTLPAAPQDAAPGH